MIMLRWICLFLWLTMTWAQAEERVPASRAEMSLSFAPLVREAAPAVVNIYARRVTQAVRRSPFMDDPFFRRFFEDFGEPRPRVQNSLGSGVILTADGLVVSNYHVVGEATDIRVVLNDRREYEARVLLGNERNDLAILQLEGLDDAESLPFISLRDSDTVEVGELVLAIGNPFGVGQTVSSGIVSGLARSGGAGQAGRGYFIQTDAPINPGNSGGALIDMGGQVIGINTRILSRSGGSNGIGFAIPANLVAAVMRQATEGRSTFSVPWAGLAGQAVGADLAETFGLTRSEGIVITAVHPLSPFATADFEVGDVIIAVDGQPVNTPAEMIFRMSVVGDGTSAVFRRVRDGAEEDVEVALILPPDTPARDTLSLGEEKALPELTVSNINPALIAELGLALDASGVAVEKPGRFGRRVGLRRGDQLRRIGGRTVENTADVERMMPERGRGTRLEIVRGNRRLVFRF